MLLLPQFFTRFPTLTARRIISVACLGLCIAAAGAAAAQPAPSVSLLFAGDIVLDGKAGKAIEQGRDPFAAFAAILNSADIRIGNLECVIATGGDPADKNYTFRADPRTLPVQAPLRCGSAGQQPFRRLRSPGLCRNAWPA
jgi:hypothetical protein